MIEIDKITDVMDCVCDMKAVVFDLDDTLYGEKEYVRSGYQAVAKELPRVTNGWAKLWTAFQNNRPAVDEVLRSEGIYTEKLKEDCLRRYRSHKPDIHLYAGVRGLLTDLRAGGIRTGIITDGRPEGQRAKIKALGLENRVDVIIVTDELGGVQYRKPCPRAFLMMQEEMGVCFAKMCYVGDNAEKDFIAPKALGMRCIWFRNADGLYWG